MKQIKRILTLLACVLTMGAMCLPTFAAESVNATLSTDSLQPGDEFTLTVSIQEITASSLGVSITCDDALEITGGEWLKTGLIASFDPATNKGVFTPGAATAISGDIFLVTLRAKNAAPTDQTVFVTVIAKNGTTTVLEETVTRSLSVSCDSHTFGNYETTVAEHSRSCTACGYTESEAHNWNSGKTTTEATCESAGEKTYTCTVCDRTKTEVIPKSAHTTETVGKKSATCEEEGYTGDEVCTVCDTLVQKGTAIPKSAHRYEDGVCIECAAHDPNAPSAPETTESATTDPPKEPETTEPTTTLPSQTTPSVTTTPDPIETPDTGVSLTPMIRVAIVVLIAVIVLSLLMKRKRRR